MPLSFSIVTPSLNQAEFLPGALRSVLEQRYPHLDYWVMDGGSWDGSVEILRAYGKALQWVSEPDRGQADAVNRGWQRSQGEILGWVNADDGLMPGALERVAVAFAAHPRAAVVYGRCMLVDRGGEVRGEYPSREFSREALFEHDFIPQPATFVRRSAAAAVGWLNPTLHYVMDYDFWLRLAAEGYEFVYLPEPLAFLRLHGDSKTGGSSSKFAEELVSVFAALDEAGKLPRHAQVHRRIWGTVYYRAARYSFWGASSHEAHAYLRRAFSFWPALARDRGFILLFLASALGRLGYRLALRLHGNPFVNWHGEPHG